MSKSMLMPTLYAGAFLFIGTAHAATLSTCTLQTTTISNPTGCTLNAGQTSYDFADSGATFQTIGATEWLQAYGDAGIVVNEQSVRGSAAVSATGDVTTYFSSNGPVRLGAITITNNTENYGGSARPGSNASVIVTDGVHTYNFGIVCDTQISCGVLPTTTVAFNLGSSFSVEETFSVSDSVPAISGGVMYYDTAAAAISFSLSETNGSPVAANMAPEPTTFALFALASLTFSVWILRRKYKFGVWPRA